MRDRAMLFMLFAALLLICGYVVGVAASERVHESAAAIARVR